MLLFTQSTSAQPILFGVLTTVSPLGPPTSGEVTVAGWPTQGGVRDRTRNRLFREARAFLSFLSLSLFSKNREVETLELK